MTPEYRELDPGIFGGDELTLYRLARARYANLSGIGAALYPGRWNRSGQEAIYTSTDIGVPVLEKLVHTSKNNIPTNLAMMHLSLRGNWQVFENSMVDRDDRSSILFCKTLAMAKSTSSDLLGLHFAVALPSVIVPAWNVVFYTDRSEFWKHVSVKIVEPFEFDPRLFPEMATATK